MVRLLWTAMASVMLVASAGLAQQPGGLGDAGRFSGMDRMLVDAAGRLMEGHPRLYFYICTNALNQQVLRASRRPLARPGGRHPDRPAPVADLALGAFGGQPSGEAVQFLKDRCEQHNRGVREAAGQPGAASPVAPAAAPIAAIEPQAVLKRRQLFPPQVIERFPHFNRIDSLVFSADGSRLLAWTVHSAVVWDLTTNGVRFESLRMTDLNMLAAPGAGLFTFVPRNEPGARPPTGGVANRRAPKGPESHTHDMRTGARRGVLRVPDAHIQSQLKTSVSPDGSLIAAVGLTHEPGGGRPQALGALPEQVIIGNARTGIVRHRLTPQYREPDGPRGPRQPPATIWGTAFSNDSQFLAAVTSDGCLTVWDVRRGVEAAVFRWDGAYRRLDGRDSIVWLGGHDSMIVPANTPLGFVRCDLATKTVQPLTEVRPTQIGVPTGPRDTDIFAVSPDGSRMIHTSRANPDQLKKQELLLLDDLTTGKRIGRIPGIPGDRAWSLRFSPDSQRLAIGTAHGDVLIYRVANLEQHARGQLPLVVPAAQQ